MRKFAFAVTASIFAAALCIGAQAQNRRYDNNRYVRHNNWRKGYRMNRNDWNRGDRVDYRQYHLSAPPRGYEWRRVDGNFVMAAVATGVIASLIAASAAH